MIEKKCIYNTNVITVYGNATYIFAQLNNFIIMYINTATYFHTQLLPQGEFHWKSQP